MRTGYFYSLVFALLASVSIAAVAAPIAAPPAVADGAYAPSSPINTAKAETGKIDLNDADAATLQRELSGIGQAKANAIVAYRESNGPFASIDELLEVKGIGKSILERNRDKVEVN